MPGRMPAKKPMNMLRSMVKRTLQNSASEGNSSPALGRSRVPCEMLIACAMTSDTAKKPRISGTKWMPADR